MNCSPTGDWFKILTMIILINTKYENFKYPDMKNIYLIFFCVLCLFSCEDPYENTTYTAFEELPAATYLASQPDDFELWTSLLEHAGLYNTLNLQRVYTLFVPTNEAVEKYLQQHNIQAVTDIPREEAAYLIKYHVLEGVAFDQSQFVSGVINAPTETDDRLSIEFREGGLGSIYVNGIARIAQLDIKVTNGIIHSIEEVLIPVKETILQKLQDERYSIFHDAVIATGHDAILNTISVEDVDDQGNLVEKRYRFTAFAVPDSIYALQGITGLEDLKTKVNATGVDFTAPENELNKYIAYHLLSQLKSYDDLANFPEGQTSMNINTLAENELISFTNVGGSLTINHDQETEAENITFVKANINAKNGVIHEISNWMPTFTPPMVTVLWDLADYPDLAAVTENYQSASLSSTYTKVLSKGEISTYTWNSMPESKYNVLSYRNNRNADGVWYQTHNYDHLRITLGPSGWVEMETPVLIEGTYKISLQFVSGRFTDNTGLMQLSLDGQQLGGQIVISNPTTDQIKTVQLASSFELTETDSHTLRIVGIDGKLLTLDYILFEPVN